MIAKLILNEGGCFRCALRFSGEISMPTYFNLQSDISAHLTHTSAPCTICLGILNPASMLPQVLPKIQQSGYEFKDYKFQVSLPSIIYLRQEWIHGKCKLSGIPVGRVVEIKDVFKWVFSPSIAQELQKVFSIQSDFKVNINFICPESDQELHEIYKQFHINPKESLQTIFKSINPERIITSMPVLKHYNLDLNVDCSHNPIYLYGNYLKLSRNISQTPWSHEGENEVKDSVQDCLSRIMTDELKGTAGILHSSVIYK